VARAPEIVRVSRQTRAPEVAVPALQGISRVIVVVLDGLRPDAITRFALPHLGSLVDATAHTLAGRTVAPSTTAAALSSLFTGVAPEVHGIRNEHGFLPSLGKRLTLLPKVLAAHRLPVRGYMRALPFGFRAIGSTVAARLGVRARFAGHDAAGILEAARADLATTTRGVLYLHWPDADIAGHADGWMSAGYARATERLDHAVGRLVAATGVLEDPASAVILLSDHGGGGAVADDHDSDHPHDRTIPILIGGGRVVPGRLLAGTSPLDVCATIPWMLGIMPPSPWQGRPLREAFGAIPERAVRPLEEAA
jgi:hypothetical protein